MIIEYFGLPASGKTYHARRFANERNAVFVEISRRSENFFYASLFFLYHPCSTLFLLREIFTETRNWKALLWHKIIMVFLEAVAREQKAHLTSGDSVIDQGLVQLLLGIYERKITEADIEHTIKFFPRASRFIYIVEADRTLREKRMKERGRRARDHFIIKYGEEYERRWFEALEHNFEVIKEVLLKKFNSVVIVND